MPVQFVSESIQPIVSTADTSRMAMGEPGLPSQFIWRGETIEIEQVVRCWRDTGPCRNGSDEQYVRKHWYEVVTSSGARMTIFFDRQARAGGRGKSRWWLVSVDR